MGERLNLAVGDGVGDMLTQLAGGERKRGEYLSSLVRGLYETRAQAGLPLETLQFAVQGHSGQLLSLHGRLVALENQMTHVNDQLSAMIASRA
jgi:hypothetical protein